MNITDTIENPVYTIEVWMHDGAPKTYALVHSGACTRIGLKNRLEPEVAQTMEPWPCGDCIETPARRDHAERYISAHPEEFGRDDVRRARSATHPSTSSRPAPRRSIEVADEEFATLVNSRTAHGLGKFEVADVTPELHAFAEQFATNYQGTFEYMVDMRANMVSYGRLTPAQAKGVLNCARADVLRAANFATPTVELTDGFFQTVDGTDVYKIQWNQTNTRLYGKSLNDGRFEYDTSAARTVQTGLGTGAIVPLTKERASAFGHLYGRCMVCSRKLTDEESIEAGIGPVCASRQGW